MTAVRTRRSRAERPHLPVNQVLLMSRRRVVVTGLGIVSPVGNDVATAWSNILAGRSGIGPITYFDVSAYTPRFGGLIRDFAAQQWLSVKDVKHPDPFYHSGFAAANNAERDPR